MIAFEFNTVNREQRVSPFIAEYIAGNCDGRFLPDAMLEDNVIQPKYAAKLLASRERLIDGLLGEMVLCLMTPSGEYRWFRLAIACKKPERKGPIYVGALADVDVQVQHQELLRHRAEIDSVSSIYNREIFLERTGKLLDAECDRAHCLLCFHIDRFKLINNLLGNAEGDQVLRHVGGALQDMALSGKLFGRQDGDVFAACVSRTSAETISLVQTIERKMQCYSLAFHFFLPTGIVPESAGRRSPASALCDQYGIPRHLLELEITESVYTESPQELFPAMEILQNALKYIPINIVKFYLRFWGEARRGIQARQSILKNIIQPMKDLHASILAEGVETADQVKFLREVGCYCAQVYFYALPMLYSMLKTLFQCEQREVRRP